MSATTSWRRGLSAFLLRPFRVDVSDPSRLQGSVALARILFGLLVVHQQLDCFGFAALADAPQPVRTACGVAAGAGLCLAAGALTPLAVLTLLVYFAYFPVSHNLGNMVSMPLLWGLLLLGAGRTYSLDALVARTRRGAAGLRPLYLFAVRLNETQVARVRRLLFVLYWGNCLNACLFHFGDDFWLRGTVLQVALATPYWNDQYHLMGAFRDGAPALYVTCCVVGLYLQVFWEVCLVPLLFCRWGRVFVMVQGTVFFLVSAVFLNLQYLPLVELVLWLVLFGCTLPRPSRPVCARGRNLLWAAAALGRRLDGVRGSLGDHGLGWLAALAFAAVVFQNLANPRSAPWAWAQQTAPLFARARGLFQALGLGSVNVFNAKDLLTGATYFVLYETGADGTPLRVVPFMDWEGGRLDYLRNDLLYFRYSVDWQRSGWERQFGSTACPAPTVATAGLVRRVALLDALLTARPGPRHYRAEFFARSMQTDALPARWTSTRHILGLALTLDAAMLAAGAREARYCFNAGPGQAQSRTREHDTMAALVRFMGGTAGSLVAGPAPAAPPGIHLPGAAPEVARFAFRPAGAATDEPGAASGEPSPALPKAQP